MPAAITSFPPHVPPQCWCGTNMLWHQLNTVESFSGHIAYFEWRCAEHGSEDQESQPDRSFWA